MAEELQEFTFGWNKRFPDKEIPDLSSLQVLADSPSDPGLISDALSSDTKMLNDQKQKLTEQLSQINYCLTWIRKLDLSQTYYSTNVGWDECGKRSDELSVDRRGSLRTPPSPSSLRLTMRRGSDPSPLTLGNPTIRSPTGGSLTRPVDFRGKRGSGYENWTPPARPQPSPIYDKLPSPKQRVIHSEEFQDTLTKFCERLSPDQGRALLKSLGETGTDSMDLSSMLLRNKMVDESDLGPLFKALEDNGLSHFVPFFEKFLKREGPDGEENDDIYMEVNTCDKSLTSAVSDPPPVPSSPRPNRPESFTKTLFRVCNSLTADQALSILHHLGEKNVKKSDLASDGKIVALLLMNDHVNVANIDRLVEALEKENLHHLGEDIKNSLTKLETKFVFPHVSPRRGSLDSGSTKNTSLTRGSRVRGSSPFRGHAHTKSMEPVKPGNLLNFIHKNRLTRSNSHEGPLMAMEVRQQSRFIERGAASDSEERDSRSSSPVRSPVSQNNVFQFGIKITEDYKPSDRKDRGKKDSADYKHFVLIRGQQFDVTGVWRFDYIARNKKGEIGLVSKDKCEVLAGADSILCGKDWFLDCPVRHSTLELLKDSPTGTFFVRDCHSKPGDLVLSVKMVTTSVKYSITVNKASYELKDQSFSSLDTLITFYKINNICVDEGKNVLLTTPLQHERCK